MKRKRRPANIPEPIRMSIPKRDYQPNKAELEAEVDMPHLSLNRAKEAFFRPSRFVQDNED